MEKHPNLEEILAIESEVESEAELVIADQVERMPEQIGGTGAVW